MFYEINFPDSGVENTNVFFSYQTACDFLDENGFNGVEALRDAIDDGKNGRQGFAEYFGQDNARAYIWANH